VEEPIKGRKKVCCRKESVCRSIFGFGRGSQGVVAEESLWAGSREWEVKSDSDNWERRGTQKGEKVVPLQKDSKFDRGPRVGGKENHNTRSQEKG